MAVTLPVILVDGVVPVADDFMRDFQALADAINALGGGVTLGTANQIAGVNGAATGTEYKTLNGTVNQISIAHALNAVTFALAAVVQVTQALAVGTNPAGTGAVRLPNVGAIIGRNFANAADVQALEIDSADRVHLGPGGSGTIRVDGQLRLDLDSTARLVLPGGTGAWAV